YHSLFGYRFIDNETNVHFFKAGLHPDQKKWVYEFFEQAMLDPEETHFELEYKFLRSDGTYADVLDRFDIIWRDGRPVKKIGALQDISTRKFHETVLAFEKEIYELNANPKIGFDLVINKLVENTESLLPGSYCSIAIVNDDQTILHLAANSLDAEFLKALEGHPVGPLSGSSGTAIYK